MDTTMRMYLVETSSDSTALAPGVLLVVARSKQKSRVSSQVKAIPLRCVSYPAHLCSVNRTWPGNRHSPGIAHRVQTLVPPGDDRAAAINRPPNRGFACPDPRKSTYP